MTVSTPIEQLAINTIRTLSIDGVQQANSGHPGTPMALAPVAYALWNDTLKYDPAVPTWPNRDRFILSCGHASMLLYSMLHLAGVRNVDKNGRVLEAPAITLDNIRNFRQLGSPCAGHPEFGDAGGIETTTGPLGQGIGNSVGMAIASKWLAARYNKPGCELFDYNVYALCSDGDLMEGVGCEAASVAGHLGLSNLCWIYDDNRITIEGHTDLAFSEDVARRFEGLGWNVARVEDANDLPAVRKALEAFLTCQDRPTLIVLRSIIGYGSPNKADTHGAHGAPLGADEVRLTKRAYGWPEEAQFLVPPEVPAHFASHLGARGNAARLAWERKFAEFQQVFPAEAAELSRIFSGTLPEGWDRGIPVFPADGKGLATRVSSGKVLNGLAQNYPWLLGGSADLAPSTMTLLEFASAGHFGAPAKSGGEWDSKAGGKAGEHAAPSYAGRNFHFGIREHGMAAICNGLSLAGLRPFCATFFVFSDYLRPSLRLASIMHRPVIYVLTHDSIGLGEDGPTHQPVEHLAACRAIPGVLVIRPGDANEVAEAYRAIVPILNRPAVLVLSRQNVPTLDRAKYAPASGVARGAYVLADAPGGNPEVILIATGSELPIALEAHQKLSVEGIKSRLVSMPCQELFDAQDPAYRESVLPAAVAPRVAVEAGIRQGWDKYLGLSGRFVGMKSFGASAPAGTLYKHFGITADHVLAEAKSALGLKT